MDFLEGFFLGRVWTDADIKPKTVKSFYLLISILLAINFGLAAIGKGIFVKFSSVPPTVIYISALILTLLLPWISAFYHRSVLPLKLVILLLFVVQYLAFFFSISRLVVPHFTFDLAFFLQTGIQFAESIIERSSTIFSAGEGLLATLSGVIVGCINIAVICLLTLLLFITLPLLVLLGIKWLHNAQSTVISFMMNRYYRHQK